MELTVGSVEMILKEYFKLNNYSSYTERHTIYYLKSFDRYVKNELKITDYRQIKEEHYYRYIEYLKLQKGDEVKLKHHNCMLRRIFRILEKEEKILVDPLCNIRAIKKRMNIRDKILSEEEMLELLSIPDISKPYGFRNRTIIEILYGTGIRARELCNLEMEDFLIEEKLLFVRLGKGKKDRILPLGETGFKYLNEYVKKIRRKLLCGKKTRKVFIGKYGKELNPNNLSNMLKEIAKKTNNKKRIYTHMIRHTFATHLLKNGAGIREIQLLLGHNSIESTQIYINLNHQHLKEEYEKYHPLENELYFDVYGREEKVLKGGLKLGIYQYRKKELT